MADIKSLEHPTLKVPYEILNKKFRSSQRVMEREISHIQQYSNVSYENGLNGLNVLLSGSANDRITPTSSTTTTNTSTNRVGVSEFLGSMAEKLKILKRKADETINEEIEATNVCKKRVDHLRDHTQNFTPYTHSLSSWRRKRLDRMIVEYMLRSGYYNSAIKLTDKSELHGLTNIELFIASREIEKSLEIRDTSKCLIWCHENRSKLRKQKSTMEFNLRVQDFIELVRSDKRLDAVKYARKYFSSVEIDYASLIQQCMALLAFPIDTQLEPYKTLLDNSRWADLIKQFREDNFRLFQLSDQSVFTVALQAGLSALKTPACYSTEKIDRNPSCPVCQPFFNELAVSLPSQHCSQSRLICNISGEPLNEHNHPMMLPNGHIYGTRALEKMALENNGLITCPKSKEVYSFKKLEKIYVM